MLRDVIRSLDYSDCAEIALALFCVAFAMMTWATFKLSRQATDSFAAIPLDLQPGELPADHSLNDPSSDKHGDRVADEHEASDE